MADTVSSTYVNIGVLSIDTELHQFLVHEVLPGLDIEPSAYFEAFQRALQKLMPENVALLAKRDELKQKLDEWHQANPGPITDQAAYQSFLRDIGYLVDEGDDFEISGMGLDAEVSQVPGPQLVVPINNARYALNAANARWGSLYDALYGNDVISEDDGATKGGGYNPVRGDKVITYAKQLLDDAAPLSAGSHADIVKYQVLAGELTALMTSGDTVGLATSSLFAGYSGDDTAPSSILLRHNDLHIDIKIDRTHPVGATDKAGVADIHLEAALSTIMDCEDSVAAVNAHEKVGVYRNWLGLIKGDLSVEMNKGGKTVTRTLNQDRVYTGVDGEPLTLKGRSLMLVRNVGHLMTNAAILYDGEPVPEGIMDAFVTGLIALHDVKGNGKFNNSEHGSVYIVKPKMHGPEEVAFACKLFDIVEDALAMPRHTLKIGIMDEERRTSANLKECIRVAKDRIFFINTGFLDRTGDEIHTVMKSGPMIPKGDMKGSAWIKAYEDRNVQIGLKCGFLGKAQIGKGMWAMPDEMARMIEEKIGHPMAGATTAWVPSPTAATLHALHYHKVNVKACQGALAASGISPLDGLLTLAVIDGEKPDAATVTRELEQNAQSILGYVVRWIDQGVGCSKVPDINDIGLMEDRATLRISAQHMANWIMHAICDEGRVVAAFEKMAVKVDAQNAGDPAYQNMAPDFNNSIAFKAALALVLNGAEQPSGYTEPILDRYRHMKLAEEKTG